MSYIIAVFLAADFWVFLYTRLLSLLNKLYPAKLTETFYIPGAYPESFEIPLYLGLTFAFVFILYFICIIDNNGNLLKTHISASIKLAVILILVYIFITNLGFYPLKGDADPYPPRADSSFYTLSFVIYVSVIAFVTLQLAILQRFFKSLGKIGPLISFGLVITIIAVFLFEPHFPISGMDYSFFSGPIWEVSQGRTILTDTPSQYGVLPILFFALLSKLNLFRISYLPYFFWTLFLVEYALFFYLIYNIGRSFFLALVGLFSLITINYFSISHIPLFTPQTGPLRWLPLFFSLFLLFKLKKVDAKILIFIVALSVYWILDTGLYLIMAYLMTLFVMTISKMIQFIRVIKAVIRLGVYLGLILLFLDGAHLLFGYKSVNMVPAFAKIQQYSRAGFNMIVMPDKSYFWLVILVYFASIIYIFRNEKQKLDTGRSRLDLEARSLKLDDQTSNLQLHNPASSFQHQISLLLFSANLSLFGGIYFLGRSHPHALFWIAPLTLVNFFLLINMISKNQGISSSRAKIFLGIFYFIVLIAFPIYNRKEVMMERIIQSYKRILEGKPLQASLDSYLNKKYSAEKKLIEKNLLDKKVAILHSDETYFLYMTNKQNLLLTNPQTSINSKADLTFALHEINQVCPEKIAIDCRLVGKCSENWTFAGMNYLIQPYLLAAIEKSCRVKYEPVECTSQLCIAKASL